MKHLLVWLIRVYKQTEPTREALRHQLHLAPAHCRFHPTCSTYMVQAIEKYGALRGFYIGIRRIWRCSVFHKGGYDPIP